MADDILAEAWVAVRAKMDEFEAELTAKTGEAATKAGESSGTSFSKQFTIGAAAVAGGAGAIANSYDEARAAIVKAGVESDEVLAQLLDTSREIASSGVSTSLGEIGAVVGELNQRTRLTPDQIAAVGEQLVKLAEISGGDAATTTNNLLDLFSKWSVPTARQADLLDFLWRAAQRAGGGIDDIIGTLNNSAGPLQRFGFSIEEAASLTAELERRGGNAEKILGTLGMAFGRLSQDTNDPISAFDELSRRIQNAETDAEAMRIGTDALGSRTATTLVPAIRAGRFEVDKFVKALAEGTGTIQETHEESRTLLDVFDGIRNKIGAAIAPASQWIATAATIAAGAVPVATGIGNVRDRLSGMVDETMRLNPELSRSQARTKTLGGALQNAIGPAAGLTVAAAALTAAYMIHEAQAQRTAEVTDETAQGFLNGTLTMEEWSQKLDESSGLVQGFTSDTRGLVDGLVKAREAVYSQVKAFQAQGGELTKNQNIRIATLTAEGKYQKALALVDQWQRKTAQSGEDLTQTHKQQADAARELRLAELALVGGLVGVTSGAISLRDAQRELTGSEEKLQKMLRNGKRGSAEYAEQLRTVRANSLNVLQSQNSLTASVLEFVDQQAEAGTKTKDVVAQVREQGEAANLTGKQIRDLVRIARDAIKENENFGESAQKGGRQAESAYGGVGRMMGGVKSKIGAAGRDGGREFASGARSGAAGAKDALGGVPSALSFLPGRFGTLGTQSAQGFSAGFGAIVADVGATIDRMLADVAGKIRPGSPSRVFAQFGLQSRQGFATGFMGLSDDVGHEMDRVLAKLREADSPARRSFAIAAPGAAGGAASGVAVEDAVERALTRHGSISPIIVQGRAVMGLTEAYGDAEVARRKRSVLLGGRVFRG